MQIRIGLTLIRWSAHKRINSGIVFKLRLLAVSIFGTLALQLSRNKLKITTNSKFRILFAMEQPPSKQPKLDIKEMKPIAASFDTLPNEIVEISIKMALKSMNTQEKYHFLTDVIPKVSKRLKDISKHKSLWKGISPIEMLPNDVAEVIIRMAIRNPTKHRAPASMKSTQNLLIDMIAKYFWY